MVGANASRSPSSPSPKLVVEFSLTDLGLDSLSVLGVGVSISTKGASSEVELCGGMGSYSESTCGSDVDEESPPSIPKERFRLNVAAALGG